MRQVGVRELKEQGSQILRRVREDGEAFEVTYHGKVVARLVPVTSSSREESVEAWLARWDQLGKEISADWPPGLTAADAIRQDRGEL